MAKFTATVTLKIERRDGTETVVTEVVPEVLGDNSRYERIEATRLLDVATSYVLDKVQGPATKEEL